MSFSVDQWHALVKSMPDMLGFSGFDHPVLELALEKVTAEEKRLIHAVLEKGSALLAAKELTDGGDIRAILAQGHIVKEALASLQKQFKKVLNELYP